MLFSCAIFNVGKRMLPGFLSNPMALAGQLRAAYHWTHMGGRAMPPRVRWWESPAVVRHVNERICGHPLEELGAATAVLIKRTFPGLSYDKAISVACGTGFKEMMLLQAGLVGEFHLFEIAKARVQQGRILAERLGLSDRIVFHSRNAFELDKLGGFDLVHWNNALHHMLDVAQAVRWSREILKDGGVFFMDDFVGPSRMQWSDRTLRLATKVRRALPERFLRDPYHENRMLSRKVVRPNRLKMYLSDPTECADSARILESLAKSFPNAEIIPTGGVVYNLALMDVLHNIGEVEDKPIIEQLLRIDDLCTGMGEFHHAVAIGAKI